MEWYAFFIKKALLLNYYINTFLFNIYNLIYDKLVQYRPSFFLFFSFPKLRHNCIHPCTHWVSPSMGKRRLRWEEAVPNLSINKSKLRPTLTSPFPGFHSRSTSNYFFLNLTRLAWGRCYDHKFLRFFPIFGEKNWRFSKIPMLWSNIFQNLALFWVKNANFFAKFFGENTYFKNHNIGPSSLPVTPSMISGCKYPTIQFTV
jgi:hypothetical protein